MEFSSSRLEFRPFTLGDVSQTYIDWLNDHEVNRYLESRHVVQTRELCEAYVRSVSADPNSHFFAVFEKASGAHIGNSKIGFINPIHRYGELSLFIGEKGLWGQGYGTEIVNAMTRFGFTEAKLEKIEAGCYEQNLGSLRSFLKNGYAVEGFMRGKAVLDGVRSGTFWLGILRDDYERRA